MDFDNVVKDSLKKPKKVNTGNMFKFLTRF